MTPPIDHSNPPANGTGHAMPPGCPPEQRPIRREQYLHRFGTAATLMTVESFQAADGTLTPRRRFAFWPGL